MTGPLMLEDLCLHPRDEADIRFLLCEAEGALGLRSNLGPMLARQEVAGGRNSGSKPLGAAQAIEASEQQMEAASRARRVSARFGRLSRADQRTLIAVFGPPRPAFEGKAFDDWLGTTSLPSALILLTALRQRIGRAEVARWKDSLDKREGAAPVAETKKQMASLRKEAWLALIKATTAYKETRHG